MLRDRLRHALARRRGLVLLSDFDGTLTPIVARPGAVRLTPRTRRLLRRLARHPQVRLGIISGRSLRDLRRRARVPGAALAGCHGLEIAWRGAPWSHRRAAALRPLLRRVARELRRSTARLRGVLVEPKGLCLSLHYRRTDRRAVPALERLVGRILAEAPALELLRGKKVLELRPRLGWGKGQAVEILRRRLAASLRPRRALTLYLGDDATDEEAFRALGRRAVCVAVGPRGTRAPYRLAGPSAVADLLAWLDTTLRNAPQAVRWTRRDR